MRKDQLCNAYNVKIKIENAENDFPRRVRFCASLLFNFNVWLQRVLDSNTLLRFCHTVGRRIDNHLLDKNFSFTSSIPAATSCLVCPRTFSLLFTSEVWSLPLCASTALSSELFLIPPRFDCQGTASQPSGTPRA